MSNAISGNSLAAELLLNKIMNGQVQTESGKTVTAGSRMKASELNRQAVGPSIASANVKAGVATAVEIQTRLTEAKAYLENLDKALADTTMEAGKKVAADAVKFMNNFATTKIDSVTVFGAPPVAGPPATGDPNTIDISLGLGGDTDVLTLGGIDFSEYVQAGATTNAAVNLKSLADAGTQEAFDTALALVLTDLETGIAKANSNIGLTGMQIQTLEGRSAILDDLSATFTDAAAQQFVVGTGGANDLLNNVLN